MNWKNYVEKQNAKVYTLPAGWDSRESIAEQLECSPDRVREHLQPGIAAKEIESRQFPVWDSALGRKVAVTAYRQATVKPSIPAPSLPAKRPGTWSPEEQATARKLNKEGRTHRQIGAQIGRSREAVRLWLNKH
jgi:biotin operon repressor